MSTTRLATRAVRAGIDSDAAFGAVIPPLHLSSNFSFAGFGEKRKYDYSRSGNPTRDALACALADLEGGVGGVITATGMAAVTLVVSLLEPGDLLVAPHDCYGGTWRLFNAQAGKGLYRVAFVDFHDPLALAAALAEKPKLVWIETPSNPLLRITDIRHVVESSHAVGALTVVDNTFLSPALQRPFEFNADIVVHSTTKYINGHSDVVGGAVIWRDAALGEKLAWWCNCLGISGAPFDSYLTLRGLRTLKARFAVHETNARGLAELLDRHPVVCAVHYPGLPKHPGHALAKRQQSGFGAMLSFE
ncbi:MAG: aminotransferase class I/II-fold pyridoxal phosphate-dependent enzyme, partial [Dokdonella sp.]